MEIEGGGDESRKAHLSLSPTPFDLSPETSPRSTSHEHGPDLDSGSSIDDKASDAVVAFVRTDYQRVLGTVGYLCGQDVDAPSILAEAVARLLEQLAKGKSVENIPAWVTRAAVNLGRSELRHQAVGRRKLPLLRPREVHSDPADRVVDQVDLGRALAQLPKRQGEVVALHYGLDMSVVEIARSLGLTVGGTKASLAKARKSLAAVLGTPEAGDGHE